MKWKWYIPDAGDKRVIKKFLFIPRVNNHELRWLEIAYISQEYCNYQGWEDITWSSETKYLDYLKQHELKHRN